MIARIWHGRTAAEHFETYTDYLKQVAIPDYRRTPGFKGLTFLRRLSEQEAHFNLITYWDTLDVIRNFAGQDIEKAKYYPEDNHFLLEFEDHVQHYEVFAEESKTQQPN